jgi:hypothetical protein
MGKPTTSSQKQFLRNLFQYKKVYFELLDGHAVRKFEQCVIKRSQRSVNMIYVGQA